jgi:DNA mismatch repair protein MutL
MTNQTPTVPFEQSAGVIRVLPDPLVNKIAAGEVVERPASVVKELLENAVDAGASQITVTIEGGGRSVIRVSDNGSGMSAVDAPLAFARHATSKIRTVEDLFYIRTMGFRGEALASVAGVSHTTLVTRRQQDQQALRIVAHESVIEPPVPCAAAVGTTIEVRDLFYCVPARRKFLRADSTELGHIHEMVSRTALAFPGIGLNLSHNGRTVVDLPGTSDHRLRVAQVLGRELYDQLIPVDSDQYGVQVTGFIGTPEVARATARFQHIFLNGRFIRDRSVLHAVKEAYRGLIEPAAQPLAVLFLQMDPAAFDVNVHPQKTEVRFRDANAPYRSVLAAVRGELLKRDLTPAVRIPSGGGAVPSQGDSPQSTRQMMAEFFRQPATVEQKIAWPNDSRPDETAARPRTSMPVPATSSTVVAPVSTPEPLTENLPAHDHSEPAIRNLQDQSSAQDIGRFIQIHQSYLIIEEPQGVLIVDQHALHERIIYEDMLSRVRLGPLQSQRLLLPVVVAVNPRQLAAFETARPVLAKLGIEVDCFDSTSVAVQSLPVMLARLNPTEFLRELLDKITEFDGRISEEDLLHEVLDLASCKAAIKAGDPLTPEEIRTLLLRRAQVERSSNCPHGRPTTIRLTLRDLEKQFKRR